MVSGRRQLVAGALAFLLLLVVAVAETRAAAPGTRPAASANGTVMVAIFDGTELSALESQISPYMQPGDGVATVVHGSNPSTVNSWAASLQSVLPSARYTYRAYWGLNGTLGTPGIANLSGTFTQVSADWEVNGPSQFHASPFCTPYWPENSPYMTTCQYFQGFSSVVNGSERQPVAYVTAQGISGDYVKFGWNYASIDGITGLETIETQGFAHDLAQWESALGKLVSEFQAQERPLSQLSVQVSLGTGGNGVNVSSAVAAINYAYSIGIPQVFLWFGDKTGSWAASVLQQINRGIALDSVAAAVAPPAPTSFAVSNVQSEGALFSWTNPSGVTVRANTVYLATAGQCGNWTIVDAVPASSSAQLVNLTPSTSYCAVVTDTNSSGESNWSSAIDFSTPAALDPIAAVFISDSTGQPTSLAYLAVYVSLAVGAIILLDAIVSRHRKR